MRQFVKRFVEGHKLFVLVAGVILVSFILVGISMNLYYGSDAYRIDLSRPEFIESREKMVNDQRQDTEFSATGEITEAALKDFYRRYDDLSKRVFESKAFTTDVLSDKELDLIK